MTITEEAVEVVQGACPEWCVVTGEHVTHYSAAMRRGGEHRVEVVLEQDGTCSVTVESTGGTPMFLDPESVATLFADVSKAADVAWPERVVADDERMVVLGARIAVLEETVSA